MTTEKISTSLNNDNFFQINVFGHFYCIFTVHIAHTTDSKPKMSENCNNSHYQQNLFIKMIIEKKQIL